MEPMLVAPPLQGSVTRSDSADATANPSISIHPFYFIHRVHLLFDPLVIDYSLRPCLPLLDSILSSHSSSYITRRPTLLPRNLHFVRRRYTNTDIMPQDDEQEDRPSHSSNTRVSFEPPRTPPAASPRHIRYNLTVDTDNLAPPQASPKRPSRSDTDVHRDIGMGISPILRRRMTRAQTFKTVEDYDELDAFDATFSARPGWQPGSEPGFDPTKADGGHASMPTLIAPCEISVIDFCHNNVVKQHFENETFIDFLDKPKPKWANCRWININGLSWDVIQAVGNKKNLHKLALEDVLNIRNRTKADW
jgi:hypothetical protein